MLIPTPLVEINPEMKKIKDVCIVQQSQSGQSKSAPLVRGKAISRDESIKRMYAKHDRVFAALAK